MIVPLIAVGALTFTGAGVGFATANPRCQWFGPLRYRGTRDGPPHVALTFDDGPTPGATEQVLAVLADHAVKATFFCIGRNVDDHPDLLRMVHEAGHLIANHSYDHPRDSCFHGRRYWTDQIAKTNAAIHKAVDVYPRFFRPPMGLRTPRILWAARMLNLTTVTWTHRSLDATSRSPERIHQRLTSNAQPGSVLVMHDGAEPGRHRDASATLAALPKMIESMRATGLEFATLDQVLDEPGYKTAPAVTSS